MSQHAPPSTEVGHDQRETWSVLEERVESSRNGDGKPPLGAEFLCLMPQRGA